MYGAQTHNQQTNYILSFENDVEMYGAQTSSICIMELSVFENDVEMYGAQTLKNVLGVVYGLRMM